MTVGLEVKPVAAIHSVSEAPHDGDRLPGVCVVELPVTAVAASGVP